MNKIFLYCSLFISLILTSLANNFEIIPIIINFRGVEARNDTIIAFGDYGSLLISYDFAKSWKQVSVFNRGIIIKIYWDDTTMAAFNDAGDVACSSDKGLNWNYVTNLGDSVLAVIKYPEGYFIRKRNKLCTFSDDFNAKNEYQLYSRNLTSNISFYTPNYTRTLAYFKDELIAEADTSNFIIFDKNLIPVDTITFFGSGMFDSSYTYKTGYQIDIDSLYFYFKVETRKRINDTLSKSIDSIYRTKDFKIIEPFDWLSATYSIYKLIDNKFYCLQKNDKYLLDTTKLSNTEYQRWGNDFTIVNNIQIIVGANKLIELVDLKDSSINIISEFSNWSRYIAPDKIGNNSYLFYSGDFYKYLPFIYRTDDNGTTIKPIVEIGGILDTSEYRIYRFRFKYFDDCNNIFYLGGNIANFNPTILFKSYDYCKNFTSKLINDLNFQSDITYGNYKNAFSLPNLQKNGDNFIIASGHTIYKGSLFDGIVTLNNEFEVIADFHSIIAVIDYVHSKDTNTFLIHCANAEDKTSEVRFTNDHGSNWKIIKKYPISDTLTHYKEIEINNQKYLALVHYNGSIPILKLDVINLENNEFYNIYEWKTDNPAKGWGWFGVGIVSENNWVYITFQDTIFYTNDLFDKSKWKYLLLPNNGRIKNRPFKKFDDKFFVGYADNNFLSTRGKIAETNIFWLKPLDSILSIDDSQIEVKNYLYAYPPFPIPAKNYIKTLIYWDTSIDIDKDEIAVFNIYGEKLEGRERIRIDKQNQYSGWLVWDCSGVDSGIYFIKLNHGTRTIYLKVMIDR